MPNTPPQQATFDEASTLLANPHLQQLIEWYPDKLPQILAAWRRRQHLIAHPYPLRPPAPTTPRPRHRTPSRAGQYRNQVSK